MPTNPQPEEDVIEVALENPPNLYRPHIENKEIFQAAEYYKKEWLNNLLFFLGMAEDELEDYESDKAVAAILELKIAIYNRTNYEMIVQQAGVDVGEWAMPDIIVFQSEDGKHMAHLSLKHWSVASIDQGDDGD